jgi:hypothetical protein
MSPTNKKKHGKSKTATTTPEISPPDMSSHTRVAFRDFIELADVDTINTFLAATTSMLESENLELLWKRAYKEGFENSQKAIQPILQRVGGKLEEKFEKGVARGMDIGREEGYTVAKEAFDRMLVEIEARVTPKASTGDANIQTDPPIATTTSVSTQTDPPATATTSVSIQTSPTMFAATSHSQTLSENAKKLENLLNHSEISPKLAVFSPQTPSVTTLDPLEPSTTTTALKTRSTTTNFTENHQKVEDLPIFTAKTPEPHVSARFSWADDAVELPTLPTAPTKQPRDLSGLRSSNFSKNPFSSLQCRRRKFNKNRFHFFNSNPQRYHHHTFPGPYRHSQKPHYCSQPPLSVSLDWNQDPRLLNLSNALKALGWVRQ